MKRTLTRLFRAMGNVRLPFAAAVAFAAANVVCTLLAPVAVGRAVDRMAGAGKVLFPQLGRLVLILLGLYVLSSFFLWLMGWLTNRMSYRMVGRLREMLFAKLSVLPLSFYDGTPHGDTVSRFVNDAEIVSDGVLQGFTALLSGVFTLAGSVACMCAINWGMAAAVIVTAPAAFGVARYIATRSQRLFRLQARQLGQVSGYAEEIIDGGTVVRLFDREAQAEARFGAMNGELYNSGVRSQFISSLANPSTRVVNNIAYALVGVIGCLSVIYGKITVGDISSFLIFSALFAKPLNDITNITTQIQAAAASARRLFRVIDLPPETPDAPDAVHPAECRGEVEFRDVSFAYEPGGRLIEHFDLKVAPGSRVAIVGHTGAGKTTLVNLLMRFYDVDAGAILVDGVDIRRMRRDDLRRRFGMVLQDTWLCDGSVRDNIAYAVPGAPMEAVVRAARAAGADGFIRRLPEGYDTVVGGEGDTLSLGQKQLLTIARVMLAGPPMLILDEATSSIDTYTEMKIQQALDRMTDGRTSFVIAHRLSTVRHADCILVMDKGRIVERGRHEELLAAGGVYAELYRSQFANLPT